MARGDLKIRLRHVVALASVVFALTGAAAVRLADAQADVPLNQRVLVVYNRNAPDSLDVAQYYMARRGIPAANLCAIETASDGFVGWNDFGPAVKTPVRNCLDAVGRDQILYIVFAYRTPFQIEHVPTGEGLELRALDQFIADIWDEYTLDNGQSLNDHPYFAGAESQLNRYQPFVPLAAYRATATAKRVYSVWRLDAASPELAKGLVDKALAAEASGLGGLACLDRNRGPVQNQLDEDYNAAEWDLHRAAMFAQQAGFGVAEDDNPEEFGTAPAPARCDGAALYSGWYSFNNYNDAFTWNTGAVGFHLDSASALNPRAGTNWAANALSRGITVTSGSVTEPFLTGLPHPDGVVRNLFEGANVGDAFLRNTAYLKWVVLNMGDPLYRPFPGGRAPFNSATYTPPSVTFDAGLVVGGRPATATVTLDSPAPAGGRVVQLTSSLPNAATVPDGVTVPEGATSATFQITTHTVLSQTSVVVMGAYAGGDAAATLKVVPLLRSITLEPLSVVGGAASTGRVWLNGAAPAGGTPVLLASANPLVAAVPASVTVPAGELSATFQITTAGVAVNTRVDITATHGGVTTPANLLVRPGTPPAPTPTPTPTPAANAATYLRTDSQTGGDWQGVYGADGYEVVNDAVSYPSYAQVTQAGGLPYTWSASTGERRALRRASGVGRIASTWYNWTEFTIDISLNDGQEHALALYCVDWEAAGRTLRLEMTDASSGAMLDTRTVSDFAQGKYVAWNVKGRVRVRVLNTGPANAVVSGVFFGPPGTPGPAPTPTPTPTPPPPGPTPTPAPVGTSAAYVRTDAATRGDWQGVYGADGYEVVNDAVNYPSYAQITRAGANPYTWSASTAEARALRRASGVGRIASTWYNWTEFSLDISLNDGQEHEVALYLLDWEAAGRVLSFEVVDVSSGAVLDTRVVSDFAQGKYVVWNVRGHVRLRVVNAGAANAVVSGIFFGSPGAPGPAPTPMPTPTPNPNPTPTPTPVGATAAYLRTDAETRGDWQGVYGADGYEVVNDSVSYPSYAQVTLTGANPYTWLSATGEARALRRASGVGRIAATWYNWTEFAVGLDLTDAQEHEVALYLLDWEAAGRVVIVEVRDATTGAVLDSRAVSDFAQGKYVVWRLRGRVRLRVVNAGAANAVVSGIFFGPAT